MVDIYRFLDSVFILPSREDFHQGLQKAVDILEVIEYM